MGGLPHGAMQGTLKEKGFPISSLGPFSVHGLHAPCVVLCFIGRGKMDAFPTTVVLYILWVGVPRFRNTLDLCHAESTAFSVAWDLGHCRLASRQTESHSLAGLTAWLAVVNTLMVRLQVTLVYTAAAFYL